MCLPTIFEQYVQHSRYMRGWSPKTVAIHRLAFGNFQTAIGQEPEITKGRLESWVVWILGNLVL